MNARMAASDPNFRAYLSRYGVTDYAQPDTAYDYYSAYRRGLVPTRWSALPSADQRQDIAQVESGQRPATVPLVYATPFSSGRDTFMWPDSQKAAGTSEPFGTQAATLSRVPSLSPLFPTKGAGGFLALPVEAPLSAPNQRMFEMRSQQQQDAMTLLNTDYTSQEDSFSLLLNRLGMFGGDGATYTPLTGPQKAENDQTGGTYYKPSGGVSGAAGTKGTGQWGLQVGVSTQIQSMIAAARAAGFTVGVGAGGGWRSYQQQVDLKASWTKRGKAYMAATPGKSRHGWGLAADLEFGSDAARKWAHANAAKFGLRFPMSYESWHIEPIRIVNGSTKSGTGAPTVPVVKPKAPTAAPAPKPVVTSRNGVYYVNGQKKGLV
jgi:LAS superfamily LD-carboxypeptidase LdcB